MYFRRDHESRRTGRTTAQGRAALWRAPGHGRPGWTANEAGLRSEAVPAGPQRNHGWWSVAGGESGRRTDLVRNDSRKREHLAENRQLNSIGTGDGVANRTIVEQPGEAIGLNRSRTR
jgi:hypothetical protein